MGDPDIRRRVRVHMALADIASFQALADLAGVKRDTVLRLSCRSSIKTLDKIARALGCEVSDLVGKPEERECSTVLELRRILATWPDEGPYADNAEVWIETSEGLSSQLARVAPLDVRDSGCDLILETDLEKDRPSPRGWIRAGDVAERGTYATDLSVYDWIEQPLVISPRHETHWLKMVDGAAFVAVEIHPDDLVFPLPRKPREALDEV